MAKSAVARKADGHYEELKKFASTRFPYSSKEFEVPSLRLIIPHFCPRFLVKPEDDTRTIFLTSFAQSK